MSKINYTVYDETTGEIVATGTCTYQTQLHLTRQTGQRVLMEPSDFRSQYVDLTTLEVKDRPTVPAPSASYDLTALPAETIVIVTNEADETLTITDLSEALTLTDPGAYQVEVLPPFPYLPINQTVEVL